MEERGRKKREMEGAEEGGARFKRTDRVGMGVLVEVFLCIV